MENNTNDLTNIVGEYEKACEGFQTLSRDPVSNRKGFTDVCDKLHELEEKLQVPLDVIDGLDLVYVRCSRAIGKDKTPSKGVQYPTKGQYDGFVEFNSDEIKIAGIEFCINDEVYPTPLIHAENISNQLFHVMEAKEGYWRTYRNWHTIDRLTPGVESNEYDGHGGSPDETTLLRFTESLLVDPKKELVHVRSPNGSVKFDEENILHKRKFCEDWRDKFGKEAAKEFVAEYVLVYASMDELQKGKWAVNAIHDWRATGISYRTNQHLIQDKE